jgi:hypothetical protein
MLPRSQTFTSLLLTPDLEVAEVRDGVWMR